MAGDALTVGAVDSPESAETWAAGKNASPNATVIRETREEVFIDWTRAGL
jgi:hypothetical protein